MKGLNSIKLTVDINKNSSDGRMSAGIYNPSTDTFIGYSGSTDPPHMVNKAESEDYVIHDMAFVTELTIEVSNKQLSLTYDYRKYNGTEMTGTITHTTLLRNVDLSGYYFAFRDNRGTGLTVAYNNGSIPSYQFYTGSWVNGNINDDVVSASGTSYMYFDYQDITAQIEDFGGYILSFDVVDRVAYPEFGIMEESTGDQLKIDCRTDYGHFNDTKHGKTTEYSFSSGGDYIDHFGIIFNQERIRLYRSTPKQLAQTSYSLEDFDLSDTYLFIGTTSDSSQGRSQSTITNITGDMLPLDFTHLPNYDDQSNLTSEGDSITISNPSSNAIFLLKNVNQYLGLDPSVKLEFDYHLDGSYLVLGLRNINTSSYISPFYLHAEVSSVGANDTPLPSLNDLHLKLEIFENGSYLVYPCDSGLITAKRSFSRDLSEYTFAINLSSSTGYLTNYSGSIPYSLFMDESNWTNVEISDDTITTTQSCWFSGYNIADFFADFKEALTGTIEIKDGKADLSGIITVTTEPKEYIIHAEYKGTEKYLDGEGTGTLRIT